MQKTFQLNTGQDLPAVGLGTWQSTHDVAVQAIKTAIASGYRHIDTAWSYGNEQSVGEGIRQSGLPREELFVTGKLWQTWHRRAEEALNATLESLQVEYLDLWLMHWPVPLNQNGSHPVYPKKKDGSADLDEGWDFLQTWKAMEDIHLAHPEKVRAIGVSNQSTHHLAKILQICRVAPAVNQVELHPLCQQPKLARFCRDHNIQLVAYSPLGSGKDVVLNNPDIVDIAKRAEMPVSQLVLSWGVQKGWAVLPKSASPQRIQDNLNIITLPESVMEEVDAIGEKSFTRTCRPYWAGGIFSDDD